MTPLIQSIQRNSYLQLLKSKTVYNAGITFVSQVGSKFLSAVAIMLVIRHLTQLEFGAVSVVQSLIIIFSGVFLQGINWALIRTIASGKKGEKVTEIVHGAFYSTIFIAAGMGFIVTVVFVFSPNALGLDPLVAKQWMYITFGLISTALVNFLVAWFQGKELFREAAILSFVQSLILILVYGVLSFLHLLNLRVVFICMAGVPLLSFFVGILTKKEKNLGGSYSWQNILGFVKNARWYIVYSSLLMISSQLDILMMARFFSLREVGIYSVASKLFVIFLLALNAIHTVLLPKLSSIQDVRELRRIILRYVRSSTPVGILIFLILFIFPRQIVWLFAGNGYLDAARPLQVLGLCAAVSIIFSPSVNVLFALDRTKIISFSGILLTCISLTGHLLITSRYGAIGAALTTLLAYSAINIFLFISVILITSHKNKPPIPILA